MKVDPREFDMLNRRFYSGEGPHHYFDHRLSALAAHLSAESGPRDAAAYEYNDFEVSFEATDEPDLKARDRFAAEDATVLLHHACECFLRLFLAHSEMNLCPWVTLAELRTPGVFMTQVRSIGERLPEDEALVNDLLNVLALDSTSKIWGASVNPEKWQGHRDSIVAIVQFAVERVTGEANLYNSAKHGFGIDASETGLRLGPTDDKTGFSLSTKGPSITYLEHNQGPERWSMTTTWVHPEKYLGAVFLVTQQIRNLWLCARARYVEDRTRFGITNLVHSDVQELLQLGKMGFNVGSMQTSLYTVQGS